MAINWGNVWVIIRREFLERVRKKSFLILTILTPVLFGGLTILPGFLMMKGEKVSKISVIDRTGWAGPILMAKEPETAVQGAKSDKLDDIEKNADRQMLKAGEFIPAGAKATIEGEKRRLLAKDVDGILVLENGPEGDLAAEFYGENLGNPRLMGFLERKVNRAALRHRLEGKGVDPALMQELDKSVDIRAVKVEKSGATKSGSFLGEYLKALMFWMLLYTLIVMYGWALMRGVMEEKTGKIAEVILSGIRPFELMLGKIVGIASVGLLQYALWFLMGFALYMANPMNIASKAGSSMVKPGELLMLVAFYLFGFVFFASIYAAMGAIVTTDQEAQQVNMPIVMCMVLPVMLLGLILQNPDATWVVVLCFIPFFAPTLMVMRASLVSVPLWQIFASLASLAVGTMVMAYLGAKVFRIGILMTGKRPTVPEILRWIREK